MYKTFVAAVDGITGTGVILKHAAAIARQFQGAVIVVHYQYINGQSRPGNKIEQLMIETRRSRG